MYYDYGMSPVNEVTGKKEVYSAQSDNQNSTAANSNELVPVGKQGVYYSEDTQQSTGVVNPYGGDIANFEKDNDGYITETEAEGNMTEEERLAANELLEERRAAHDKDVAEITQIKESAAKKDNGETSYINRDTLRQLVETSGLTSEKELPPTIPRRVPYINSDVTEAEGNMTEEERLKANKLLEERRAVHDKDVAEITQTKESVAKKDNDETSYINRDTLRQLVETSGLRSEKDLPPTIPRRVPYINSDVTELTDEDK